MGIMLRPLTVIACILLLGLSLSGCTKCGWIWEDWHACHSVAPR